MRILLTGGSGSVGQAVVDRLISMGHTVRVIGRKAGVVIAGAEYCSCDITDYPCLREVIKGCNSVAHLAAIPNPGKGRPEDIFRINCQGTYNVFQAASEEGIQRIVQASSINSVGQYFGIKPAPLQYLPLDEQHPVFSTDTYSFSKNIIEEIGEYFWRRERISSLALRLPWVAPANYHDILEQRRERIHAIVTSLLKLDRTDQLNWFSAAWASYNTFRAERPYEKPGHAQEYMKHLANDQQDAITAMTARVNFFTMIDERDSAQAMEKGLTAEFEGCHHLFINDSLNWSGFETKILTDLFYPDVKTFKNDLSGFKTLVSIDRAKELIGYEPEFSFGV